MVQPSCKHRRPPTCLLDLRAYVARMIIEGEYDLTTGAGLVACPRCDALHIERELESGETARCVRCNKALRLHSWR